MENKIKCIETLINAFKSRNEKLAEEIETNDNTIKSLMEELEEMKEESNSDVISIA